ncbi:Na+ dependent nucleoside transporter N-terminal domain-containing protein [Escherichia coli]
MLTIAFLLSVNKKKISLRTVGAALVLQVVIGGIMLWLPPRGVGSLKKSLLACIK